MNIACYNLRFGGNANNRVHWQRMFETAEPAIFLAQETCDPAGYLTPEKLKEFRSRVHWSPVANVRWGSAVFVRSGRIKPIVIPGYEGYITGVEVRGFGWRVGQRRALVRCLMCKAPGRGGSMRTLVRDVIDPRVIATVCCNIMWLLRVSLLRMERGSIQFSAPGTRASEHPHERQKSCAHAWRSNTRSRSCA